MNENDYLTDLREHYDYASRYGNVDTRAEVRTAVTIETTTDDITAAVPAVIVRVYTVAEVAEDLAAAILEFETGTTTYRGEGSWRDSSGRVISERAAVVEVVAEPRNVSRIRTAADMTAIKHGETCTLVTVSATTAELRYSV